jgi:uncharacterized protein YuzE
MKLEFHPIADVATTKQIEPGIMADYDAEGHLVGIEVPSASKRDLGTTLDHAA